MDLKGEEMTFEEMQRANAQIRTTNIKGKEYAEVNQRIKAFRMLYPEGTIETTLLSDENGVCIMSARVGYYDKETGAFRILGTGTAYEKETSSYINKTSYIENCETSAVGRALGMAGFGIDTSVASYEEVANAIANQNAPESSQKAQKRTKSEKADNSTPEAENAPVGEVHYAALRVACEEAGMKLGELWERYQVTKKEQVTLGLFKDMMEYLEGLNK
ncbi:MAG: hypothetical protein IKF99_09005 [Oscillospiraceae bacterium]|nr:hypothetical protein [Oscillospiraceae bacterium]